MTEQQAVTKIASIPVFQITLFNRSTRLQKITSR